MPTAPTSQHWALSPRKLSLDPQHHADSLSALASSCLREGQYDDAVRFADRRCRIGPVAQAPDYLLRAAALSAAGHANQAARDLARALEFDPECAVVNQWLLKSPSPNVRRRAADALVRRELHPGRVIHALSVLAEEPAAGVARLETSFAGATGWFVWRGGGELLVELRWEQGSATVQLAPDPSHPFAESFGAAADWSFDWPGGAAWLEVRAAGVRVFPLNGMLFRPDPPRVQATPAPVEPMNAVEGSVAIIVPVYGDYPATKACLDSLLNDTVSTTPRRIVVVDDATPDRDIGAMLSALAAAGRIHLIRQPINQGFARSTNRGLQETGRQDVLLLNADTIVPPGFLDRLRRAAYKSQDIGTVTPFSNNGEYTSFPQPFRVNDMPTGEALLALDQAAAAANSGRVVEMPNGIGFCMYVRRSCLDAIGLLHTRFGRGYYEDVDFCLRASEAGFRNVCATDVYVGHAGSRSFGAGKRALIVRNLDAIQSIYARYRAISAAFVACDPLRQARNAVERMLPLCEPHALLVVAAATSEDEIRCEARAAGPGAMPVLVATTKLIAGRIIVEIARSDGMLPQSIRFEHRLVGVEAALARDFADLPIDRVVLHDAAAIPPPVLEALRQLGKPLRHGSVAPSEQWSTLLEDPAVPGDRPVRLGLVCGARAVHTLSVLIDLIRALRRHGAMEIIVLGSTFDDLRLMRTAGVFVTGPLEEKGYFDAFERYRLSHVLLLKNIELGAPRAKASSAGSRPAVATCSSLLGRADADPSAIADALWHWVHQARRAVA